MENTITTTYADGRVETRPMTEEEIAQREADIAAAAEQKAHEEQVLAAREEALASAKAKLKKLGLKDDEISALRNELIEL
jgi:hypothetical protein